MPSVAVIGAGVSGLAVLKSLLEEGLDAVCFEANQDVGGVWYYRETLGGHPTVMGCTIMNSSKEMSCFSDFPPPASKPNYMPHPDALDYYCLYAKQFDLYSHIKLGHRVESVRPTMDHVRTGRWEVTVQNLESGDNTTTVFDAVVVCSGKHSSPRMPKLKGLDKFKGRVVHSSGYKNPEDYKGKKVLVVGIGNSASDAAVELTSFASKVYMSSRSGAWLFGRLGKGGFPADLMMFTRLKLFLQRTLPYDWVCNYVENLLSLRVDHKMYKLKPNFRALSHYPTITDDLPFKLACGKVLIRGDVDTFYENAVRFRGDDPETVKIDDVIFATGYVDDWPFLDHSYWPVKDKRLDLFLYTFPTEATHNTLAFAGMVYAFGPQAPVLEIQGRWIARVFSGKCQLPTSDEMCRDTETTRANFVQRYGYESLLNGMADWIPYMDRMAEYIGCKPNLWRLAWQDPVLFYRYAFGPALPYWYRLEGPHTWPGARDAIMKLHERVCGKSSQSEDTKKKN